MTINECLESIQKLSQDNLRILETLNKAFSTKSEHLVVNVNDTQYVIPSFISLENKINTLQQNLENIVNAPSTGEAFTYFDGTTQRIELSGYSTSPSQALPSTSNYFGVESNDIFKDFLTPMPYTRLTMPSIPGHIKNVCVKKVALRNDELVQRVKNVSGFQDPDPENSIDGSTVVNITYPELVKVLYNYTEDIDYVDYDTLKRIPLRGQNATGTYTVLTVNRNWHDENFSEYYNVTLNQPLTYFINDGTIERDMQVGDKLVTSNDKVIMEVIEITPVTRTLTVRIMYGGYVDLVSFEESEQYGTLKFYSSVDFDATKYVDVPLEEDHYICVFVAPVNDTTNVRSSWGTGLFYDTYRLLNPDTTSDRTNFEEYYRTVNNIGDTLYDITRLLNSAMYNITVDGMDSLTGAKPVINSEDLTVTQINKHLNNSETVLNIRNLYAQKNKYKTELDTLQTSIDNVNAILSDLNFNNTDNNRAIYESQLSDLNTRKSELTASVMSISNEISANVNAADTPIENAKYHVRGFLSVPETQTVDGVDVTVIKVDVEYRYRNRNSVTGNAEVIGDNDIYSDWNKMVSEYRHRDFVHEGNDPTRPVLYPYEFVYESPNNDKNVISFNQLDIPITQGEVVDIRYRYEYSIGFPFVRVYSDWSDIYTQTFPDEYMKDVPLLTIVQENNDDIKKNAMNTMLVQKGIIPHVEDELVDQNITYFHKPEHIASGFYTDERRVIPLYDMLQSIYSDMQGIKSEVYGGLSDSLVVTLYDNISSMTLQRSKNNVFTTVSYNSNTNKKTIKDICNLGDTYSGPGADVTMAYSQLMLNLYNDGEYNMKIYTMFPGASNAPLNTTSSLSRFTVTDYAVDDEKGVWIQTGDSAGDRTLQRYNQTVYFRIKDIMSDESWYSDDDEYKIYTNTDSGLHGFSPVNTPLTNIAVLPLCDGNAFADGDDNNVHAMSTLFPYIGDTNTLSIPDDMGYIVLQPGDSIDIPLSFYYYIEDGADSTAQTMQFDIRTSLFTDPDTYRFTVRANLNDSFALQGIKTVNPLGSQSNTRMLKGQVKGSKAKPVVRINNVKLKK